MHESIRVFSDRLVNDEDKQLFMATLAQTVNEVAPKNYIDFQTINPETLIFNNFVHYNPAEPIYNESISTEQMAQTIYQILDHYNHVHQKDKLNLLIFDYVV